VTKLWSSTFDDVMNLRHPDVSAITFGPADPRSMSKGQRVGWRC